MSSVDNSTRKSMQADLNDLQSDYNRKKKEISKENEEQISDLKDYYSGKKEALREENEAAINHIRKGQQDTVDHALEERQKLNESYNARTVAAQKGFEEKLADTREKNREQISEAQEHSKERVQEIQNHAQEEVTNIHAKSENDVRAAKQRYNKDMQDINAYGEKRLKHEKDQNELALHNEMERGRISQEKVHERNDTQLSQLRQKGEKQLVNEQEVQAQKLQRSDAEAARRYQINQEQWASKEKNLDHQYTQRLGDNKQSYEKQLHTQGEHFKSTYKKNEEAERESLDIQQDLYNREIADNHKKFLKASEKYTNKESDPFYKVQDRGSHLQDGGDFYVLRAYVPEHEKDAVKVSIQKDHATISGQRSFKDKLDDGSKSVSTNSFQTFREEFPFEKPIITEGMTREREGDWVVYKIPVMSSLGFTRKA